MGAKLFDRYKLICIVSIVQNTQQGCHKASRCLWDKKVDRIATHTHETPNSIVIATLYGIYLD